MQREEARRVLAALDTLRPSEQEILRLKAWEQLSNGQIAEVMGLTRRAVDTRLMRARKRLSRKAASDTAGGWATPRTVEEGGES